MAFLKELASNKEMLLKFLLSDRTLVDLLSNEANIPLPALSMRYTQVFPYHWLNNTVTEQKSYLCFSVSVPRTQNFTIKDVEMKVWTFSHEAIMRTPHGPRIDLLASSIDTLLNGSAGFGIGKVRLLSTREISPAKDFYGFEMQYFVNDFNVSFRDIRGEDLSE